MHSEPRKDACAQHHQLATQVDLIETNLASVQGWESSSNSYDVGMDLSIHSAEEDRQPSKGVVGPLYYDLAHGYVEIDRATAPTRYPFPEIPQADLSIQEKFETQSDRLSGEFSSRLDRLECNVASLWKHQKQTETSETSETDTTAPSLTTSDKDSVSRNEMKQMRAALAANEADLQQLALELAQVQEKVGALACFADLTEYVTTRAASSIKNAEMRIDRQITRSIAELERTGAAQREEMISKAHCIMSTAGALQDEASANTDQFPESLAALQAGYAFAEKAEKFRIKLEAYIVENSALMREELDCKVKATERRMEVIEQSLISLLDDTVMPCTSKPHVEVGMQRHTSTSAIEIATPRISKSPTAEGSIMATIATADMPHSSMTGNESASTLKKKLDGLTNSVHQMMHQEPASFSPLVERSQGPSQAAFPPRRGDHAKSDTPFGHFITSEIRERSESLLKNSNLDEGLPFSNISHMKGMSKGSLQASAKSSLQSSVVQTSAALHGPEPQVPYTPFGQRSADAYGKGGKASLGPQTQMRSPLANQSSEGGGVTSRTRFMSPRDSLGTRHIGSQSVGLHDPILRPRLGLVPAHDRNVEARPRMEQHSPPRSTSARRRVERSSVGVPISARPSIERHEQ